MEMCIRDRDRLIEQRDHSISRFVHEKLAVSGGLKRSLARAAVVHHTYRDPLEAEEKYVICPYESLTIRPVSDDSLKKKFARRYFSDKPWQFGEFDVVDADG